MTKVCLVEDEEDLNAILTIYLRKQGWDVRSFKDLGDARQQVDEGADAWVLDLMLPDGNGFELMKLIKARDASTPVVLISARGDSIDRVLGFEMGCDDYIAKPFMPQELIYRVKNALQDDVRKTGSTMTFGDWVVDTERHSVTCASRPIQLTTKEYDLLAYLLENQREVLSRDKIMRDAWGADDADSPRSVDNFVKRLRVKLPFLHIETIYGVGYRCVQ